MSRIEKGAKWLIFITFLVLLPSFSYMIIAIGFLPNSYFIYSGFSLIAHLAISARIELGLIIILALSLIHVFVYAFVYHRLSKLIASSLSKVQSEKIRVSVILGIVVALVVASFFLPIYFTIGEGATGPINILGVFEMF
jgi:hypothetical protein